MRSIDKHLKSIHLDSGVMLVKINLGENWGITPPPILFKGFPRLFFQQALRRGLGSCSVYRAYKYKLSKVVKRCQKLSKVAKSC